MGDPQAVLTMTVPEVFSEIRASVPRDLHDRPGGRGSSLSIPGALCPEAELLMRCTGLMLAPVEMARDAAVWRRSWKCKPSRSGWASVTLLSAGSQTELRKLDDRRWRTHRRGPER